MASFEACFNSTHLSQRWAQGLIFGVLLSLPDPFITKTFAPILVFGAVCGLIIGRVVGKWGV